MIATGADIHVPRDPTRGGVSATINELARAADIGIGLLDRALPIPEEVRDACGLLGLDPLEVANEGKLLAIVPADDADRVLAAMRRHPLGRQARIIGQCTTDHPQVVTLRTGLRPESSPTDRRTTPRICDLTSRDGGSSRLSDVAISDKRDEGERGNATVGIGSVPPGWGDEPIGPLRRVSRHGRRPGSTIAGVMRATTPRRPACRRARFR